MGVKGIAVGTEMTMVARVNIASLSDNKNGSRSMSLEILEAALAPKEDEKDAASVIFPNG